MHPVFRSLAVAAAVALCVAAEAPGGFVERFTAATRAHDAHDYAAMEHALREALELRPAHPAALYELAAAQALQGKRRDALESLESLARMGLSYAPREDDDFKTFANSERFADVVKDFVRNGRPAGRATTLFQVFIPTFVPDGIAYDEDRRAYFIGGAHERRIDRVERGGPAQPFVHPGAGGLWAPLGMVVDETRGLLWVATAAIPEMENAEAAELGRSAVLGYDLRSGERKRRFLLDDGKPGHRLGDLALARNGLLYASDRQAGLVYELNPSSGQFRALTAPGQLSSPQGLAFRHDRTMLYIADHTQGLFRYDLEDRVLTRLKVERDICAYGIDGLAGFDDDLIAVQNGIRPHRVVRFYLDRAGRRVQHARVLVSALPEFDKPTLGVVVGHSFNFVANSQWDRFDAQQRLPPKEQLRSPVVLRVSLEARRRREEPREDPFQTQPPPPPTPAPLPVVPLPIRP